MKEDLIFRQLFEQETFTYTYLLGDKNSKEAILIDTVKEKIDRDLKLVTELGLILKYVLDTHVHADHITAAGMIADKTGAISAQSQFSGVKCAGLYLKDGDKISFGPFELIALSTPGHTNGCMSFFCEGMLFTGDALLIRGCGRTDFQQGTSAKLFHSIKDKLYSFSDSTLVYPGHDYKGMTVSSIGEEKKYNLRIQSQTLGEQFIKVMSELKLDNPKKIHEAVPANLGCGRDSI